MELKEIRIADMRPDPNNPRQDFGDLKALAKTFELTPGNPGEPLNPPVVVADGGIYRIVDGARRYRAMLHAKREVCHAIVCDGMDEANSLVAMLATDDKAPLTDAERSRGVQQMLLLGVPEKRIEAAARLKRGQARQIRSAAEAVGADAARQMSIDWLLAIEDLRDAGASDSELSIVLDAPEEERAEALDSAIDAFERRQKKEAILACLDEANMAPVAPDEIPEGFGYALMIPSAAKAEEYLRSGRNIGDVLVWCEKTCSADVYRERAEAAGGASEGGAPMSEAMKGRDALEADLEAGQRRRLAWYAGCLAPAGPKGDRRSKETPVVDRMVVGFALDPEDYLGHMCSEFAADAGIAVSDIVLSGAPSLSGKAAAALYREASVSAEGCGRALLRRGLIMEGKEPGAAEREELEHFSEWMYAFEIDGYRLDDADRRVMAALEGALGMRAQGAVSSAAGFVDAPALAEDAGAEPAAIAFEAAIPVGADGEDEDPPIPDALDIGSMSFGEPALAMAV